MVLISVTSYSYAVSKHWFVHSCAHNVLSAVKVARFFPDWSSLTLQLIDDKVDKGRRASQEVNKECNLSHQLDCTDFPSEVWIIIVSMPSRNQVSDGKYKDKMWVSAGYRLSPYQPLTVHYFN